MTQPIDSNARRMAGAIDNTLTAAGTVTAAGMLLYRLQPALVWIPRARNFFMSVAKIGGTLPVFSKVARLAQLTVAWQGLWAFHRLTSDQPQDLLGREKNLWTDSITLASAMLAIGSVQIGKMGHMGGLLSRRQILFQGACVVANLALTAVEAGHQVCQQVSGQRQVSMVPLALNVGLSLLFDLDWNSRATLRYGLKSLRASPRDSATIVVTDSGLGGVSVMADVVARLQQGSPWPRVHVVYVNAVCGRNVPGVESYAAGFIGFNSYPDGLKPAVLNRAIDCMVDRFRADHILIACNTVSANYPSTRFAQVPTIPVTSIVDTGVQMIGRNLQARPGTRVAIFATPGTVDSNAYPQGLQKMGIDPSRVLQVASSDLAQAIEAQGVASDATSKAVRAMMAKAKGLSSPDDPLFLALCCTHYGYARNVFEAEVRAAGLNVAGILNPNSAMADAIFPLGATLYRDPVITFDMVGQARMAPDEGKGIGKLVESVSPETALALGRMRFDRLYAYEWYHPWVKKLF